MYKNKCTKCGGEFETKNPKRVICPGCLYPDRKDISLQSYSNILKQPDPEPEQKPDKEDKGFNQKSPGYYVARESQGYKRPDQSDQQRSGGFRRPRPAQSNPGYNQGGYRQDRPSGYNQGGYSQGGFRQDNRPAGGYNQGGYRQDRPGGYNQGGFRQDNRPAGGYNQGGGFRQDRPAGGYNQGGFRRPQYNNNRFGPGSRDGFNSNRSRPAAANKKLLISREQVNEIENLYKDMLPLPNPDCHEVIGEKIQLEPNKVFFGINLVRQKFNLPKLPYPKRKLAISADQLMAIKNLYSPLLPLPPIGCHKIIAKQLKMDEWRVHVGIGIVRKQLNLPRWNTEREDAPPEFKNQETEDSKTKE